MKTNKAFYIYREINNNTSSQVNSSFIAKTMHKPHPILISDTDKTNNLLVLLTYLMVNNILFNMNIELVQGQ